MAFHFNFAVDRLEVRANQVTQVAPEPPAPPPEPVGWQQKIMGWGRKLWPAATAAGSVLAFMISRVGIGLRGEDLAWLFRLGPLGRE